MIHRVINMINGVIIRAQRAITAILLAGMVVTVAIQIVARYFFHVATPWADELARMIMIWIALIGSAGMLIKGEHLCVDVFYRHFGVKTKKICRVVYDAFILVFNCFVLKYSIDLLTNRVIYRSKTPIMRLPLILYYLALPISMFLMAVFEVGDLYEAFYDILHTDEKGEHDA